jgi:hypothetical protein
MSVVLRSDLEVTGHMWFLFVRLPQGEGDTELTQALDGLGQGLENMHDVEGNPSEETFQRGRFQFLRAGAALSQERDIPHPALLEAHALIRLEAATAEPIERYKARLQSLFEARGGSVESLIGVQRPRIYTSHAMTQFAYERALLPRTGTQCPLGVVTPMNKTAAWWEMDWMHRESFFLPRYDQNENLVAKGHALAAESGIPYITRRLAHAPDGYESEGSYDFVGYFEFAEAHAPIFREVMTALRDKTRNPEWTYVREGPEWWGCRVRSAAELWGKG